MSDNVRIIKGSPGFIPLLTILFIALKLTHVIDWSWWWVLSPIWMAVSLFLIVISFLFLLFAFFNRKEKTAREKARKALENFKRHHSKNA